VADLGFIARHPVLRIVLAPLVFALCFVLFLFLTFPYESLARRLEDEAGKSGLELTIGRLGHSGFSGLRASEVKIRGPALQLELDRVDLRPELFSLLLRRTAFGFSFDGYGGAGKGHAALSKDGQSLTAFSLDASGLDAHALSQAFLPGTDLVGRAQLKIDLPTLVPDDAARGQLNLSLKGAGINSGSAMGFPIPKASLGDLEVTASVEKGVVKVEKGGLHGGDLDADLDGSIQLRPLKSLSVADLHLRFRPAERWLNENPMIKGSMGFIQNGKQPDGSYLFTLSGPLASLTPRPGR